MIKSKKIDSLFKKGLS